MKLVPVAVSAVLLALTACSAKDRQLEAALSSTESAKSAVLMKLKDPSSAQWGRIWSNGSRICGWVNAKNGFGGYVGSRRFYSIGSSTWIDGELPGTQFDEIWTSNCGRAEYTIAEGSQSGPTASGPAGPEEAMAESERLRAETKRLLAE